MSKLTIGRKWPDSRGLVPGAAALLLAACSGGDALGSREVYAIVDEVDLATRAEALAEPMILLASDPALPTASPEGAATELARALGRTPCIDVAQSGATLSVAYSEVYYTCQKVAYAGQETITFVRAADRETVVDHAWKGLTNGLLTVDGTARVITTPTPTGSSQRIVSTLSWVRASDGKSGHGKDDRTLTTSIVPGERSAPSTGLNTWDSGGGSWELRPIDATLRSGGVPFIGSFAVVTPEKRAVTVTVLDGPTGARVTLTDGARTHAFDLPANGVSTE